jgi:hypothetical protein
MRPLLVVAALALGLSVIVTPAAAPAGSDAQGPPCGDITNGDGGYSPTGVVDFTVFLAAPACSFVTYTFTVTDTSGNTITPVSSTTSTDSSLDPCTPEIAGGGCVGYVYTLPSGSPSVVCLSAATYIHGHAVDVAPNTSPSTYCLSNDGSGASGNFG